MTTNFIGVLLTSSPNFTVGSGFVSQIYDSRGAQTLTVQAGGSLDLVGALGANIINLHGTASAWQIWRDGSTAILSHTNGDRINLPAQLDAQKIVFSDLEASLKIHTSTGSAQVKLGDLVLDTNPVTITSSVVNTGVVSNATKAPWSLVMNASTGSKATGYTSNLLVSDGTPVGTDLLPVYQAVQNFSISPDGTKLVFTGYQNDGTVKLQMLKNNVITNQGTVDSSVQAIDMGDKVFYLPQYTGTTRIASVTDWSTDQSQFSTGIGGTTSSFKVDANNQTMWTQQYFGPFGTELVNVAVGPNGALTTSMPKDIAVGTNSGLGSYGKSGSGLLEGAVLPDGRLVFAANNGTSGLEPWISDGTEQGTKLLRELYSNSSKSDSTYRAYNNRSSAVTCQDPHL
jgi:ELWxxDGT repeat protein